MPTEETFSLDFGKVDALSGMHVLPVAVQDVRTQRLLLLAYTNKIALEETMQTGRLTLWSTSRNALWRKGEAESGNNFRVLEIRVNCEQNALLYLVEAATGATDGGICHTLNHARKHRESCFYRTVKNGELVYLRGEA
jgi:phosphoribosyl-AMP cyclohydrolase